MKTDVPLFDSAMLVEYRHASGRAVYKLRSGCFVDMCWGAEAPEAVMGTLAADLRELADEIDGLE